MSTARSRVFMTASRQGGRALRLVSGDAQPDSPYPKASLWLRGGARAVVALLFLLLADGMLQGQSVGKRIFGVKVMHLPTRSAARHRDSTLRNAPLALIVLLGMMPAPHGTVAAAAGLIVIGSVEAWRVLRDPLGWRLGDTWAQTQVVDGKVVAGVTVAARTPVAHERASGRLMSAAKVRRGRSSFRKRRGYPCASR